MLWNPKREKNREGRGSRERKLLFTKDWQQENGNIWKKRKRIRKNNNNKSTFQDRNVKIGRSEDQGVMLKPLGERVGQQIIPLLPSITHRLLLLSCWVMSNSFVTPQISRSGSSVHGISQTRILEWVVISFSRWSSWQRHQTSIPALWTDSLPPSHLGSLLPTDYHKEKCDCAREMGTSTKGFAFLIHSGRLKFMCLLMWHNMKYTSPRKFSSLLNLQSNTVVIVLLYVATVNMKCGLNLSFYSLLIKF